MSRYLDLSTCWKQVDITEMDASVVTWCLNDHSELRFATVAFGNLYFFSQLRFATIAFGNLFFKLRFATIAFGNL